MMVTAPFTFHEARRQVAFARVIASEAKILKVIREEINHAGLQSERHLHPED